MKILTDERCLEYSRPHHPEHPDRVSTVLARLRTQNRVSLHMSAPPELPEATLLRVHTARHLARIKAPAGDFDNDTPGYAGIFEHARRAAGGAVEAMRLARKGETAFSLLRPPGHHASWEQAKGFCYLNSMAIAALEARVQGSRRVAVFDFDVHHGDGTEEILTGCPGLAYFSVHQYPSYPGTGAAHNGPNSFNYPVAPNSLRQNYLRGLGRAIEDLKRFEPDLLGVSAGFDAYVHDPVGEQALEVDDYYWLGQVFRGLEAPVFSILEGGYSHDLPELVLAYLAGLEGK